MQKLGRERNLEKVNMDEFKELQVFTKDKMVSFDTKGLSKVQGFARFDKARLSKIFKSIANKVGVLAFETEEGNIEKIDLTKQVRKPLILLKEDLE